MCEIVAADERTPFSAMYSVLHSLGFALQVLPSSQCTLYLTLLALHSRYSLLRIVLCTQLSKLCTIGIYLFEMYCILHFLGFAL